MKDVVGYEEYFSITKDGKLWSKRSKRFLSVQVSPNGYCVYATKIGGRSGKNVMFRIHRLVAEAYIDNPDNKCDVNHKDGNKLNNDVSNLEWSTRQENIIHAYNNNLITGKSGIDNPLFSLTKEQIDYVVSVHIPRHKEFGANALSRKFGVSHTTMQSIINKYKK